MGRFTMTFQVRIAPADEQGVGQAVDWADETVRIDISPEEADSIDDLDERLLQGGYEAMRLVLASHLECMAKKGL